MGIAALPVSDWLVAAALSVAVVPVEAEVVKVAVPVEAAVEAETEAPVVAAALAVPVPVIVTGIITPGSSVMGTAVEKEVVNPSSSILIAQEIVTESYVHFSAMAL